jgi:hypothetical protein
MSLWKKLFGNEPKATKGTTGPTAARSGIDRLDKNASMAILVKLWSQNTGQDPQDCLSVIQHYFETLHTSDPAKYNATVGRADTAGLTVEEIVNIQADMMRWVLSMR